MKDDGLCVLHVVPGEESDPNSMIFARRQIASLSNNGINCPVFFLKKRTSLFGLVAEVRRLRGALRFYNPNVVHAHYGTITSFICAMCTRRPLIVHYRGSDLNVNSGVSSFRSSLQMLFSQLSALRARGIFTVSNQLRNRLWWKRDIAVVIPSGVDIQLFRPVSKKIARAKVGWSDEERIILFNGGSALKSRPNKRLFLARAAIQEAEKIVGNIRLEVLDGGIPPEIMHWVISASDCVLLTSASEGSPNIVKEALACNIPVVSVPVGDVPERLKGVFPSFVAAANPKALGAAIAEVLELVESSNGRQKILHLSEEALADQIITFYRKVCAPK
jgi:glycosyltransferase involved in cell wall biosynthesis